MPRRPQSKRRRAPFPKPPPGRPSAEGARRVAAGGLSRAARISQAVLAGHRMKDEGEKPE